MASALHEHDHPAATASFRIDTDSPNTTASTASTEGLEGTNSSSSVRPVPTLPWFRSGRSRRAVQGLYAGTAAFVLVLASAGAASAHDELASSSPQNGTAVETAPNEVVLTFSNPPSGIGAEIIVTDSAGTVWSDGEASVVNNTAVQALKPGAPAGSYTTQWRVVSSDDHPIEGSLTFTSTSQQAPAPGATADPTDSADEQDTAASTAADSADPADSGLPAFVLYLAGAGILAAVALALVTRRRLLNK
ncbi:copper resistance protein CopC [Vibrio cholerae]|nr:copper resistance protein CopC [Vibrio cholerae]